MRPPTSCDSNPRRKPLPPSSSCWPWLQCHPGPGRRYFGPRPRRWIPVVPGSVAAVTSKWRPAAGSATRRVLILGWPRTCAARGTVLSRRRVQASARWPGGGDVQQDRSWWSFPLWSPLSGAALYTKGKRTNPRRAESSLPVSKAGWTTESCSWSVRPVLRRRLRATDEVGVASGLGQRNEETSAHACPDMQPSDEARRSWPCSQLQGVVEVFALLESPFRGSLVERHMRRRQPTPSKGRDLGYSSFLSDGTCFSRNRYP